LPISDWGGEVVAVRGSIRGRVELREVITKLEVTAPAQLEKDILLGVREAVKQVKPDLMASALAKLPKRHGYSALVARAMKVSSRVTGGKKVVAVLRVTATGKRENRDLSSLNRGILRHPLFGNRKHWFVQRVPRGLVDDPIDRARDRVVASSRKAAEAYAKSIARG